MRYLLKILKHSTQSVEAREEIIAYKYLIIKTWKLHGSLGGRLGDVYKQILGELKEWCTSDLGVLDQ